MSKIKRVCQKVETKRFVRGVISLGTLSAFFLTSTFAWAVPALHSVSASTSSNSEGPHENLLNQIVIPQELGSVQEKFVSPVDSQSNPAPIVVHIQDAHANYEAQKNIQALIDYLNKEYGFSLVLLEGGVQKLDPTLLQIFKNPKYNAEMVDSLVQKGEVGGGEAFLVSKSYDTTTDSDAVDAFGLEAAERYRADIEQFRKIWPEASRGAAFAEKLIQWIDRASSRAMNKELRAFTREWFRFKKSRSQLNSYLSVIYKSAKEALALDLTDPRNQREWPMLLRIFKLKEIEPLLNLEKAKAEWEKGKAFLTSGGIDAALITEIKNRLYGRENSSGIQAASTRSLFEGLLDLAQPQGFTLKDYPNLSLWVGSTILRNEIGGEEVFTEIERLNNAILDQLAPTANEKGIVELFKQCFLLEDLFRLELSRENYLRVKEGAQLYSPETMIDRIRTIDASAHYPDKEELGPLSALYRECLQSYEFALSRESAFFDNVENAFHETQKHKAVTVTGGFHTSAFSEGFRARNISYLIVAPRITNFQDVEKEHQNYVSSLMQVVPKPLSGSLRANPSYLLPGDESLSAVGGVRVYQVWSLQEALKVEADQVGALPAELLTPAAVRRFNLLPVTTVLGSKGQLKVTKATGAIPKSLLDQFAGKVNAVNRPVSTATAGLSARPVFSGNRFDKIFGAVPRADLTRAAAELRVVGAVAKAIAGVIPRSEQRAVTSEATLGPVPGESGKLQLKIGELLPIEFDVDEESLADYAKLFAQQLLNEGGLSADVFAVVTEFIGSARADRGARLNRADEVEPEGRPRPELRQVEPASRLRALLPNLPSGGSQPASSLTPSEIALASAAGQILPVNFVLVASASPDGSTLAFTQIGIPAVAANVAPIQPIEELTRLSPIFAPSSQVAGSVVEILNHPDQLDVSAFELALRAAAVNPKLELDYGVAGIQEGTLEEFESALRIRLTNIRDELGLPKGSNAQINVFAIPAGSEAPFRTVRDLLNKDGVALRGHMALVTSDEGLLGKFRQNLGVAKLWNNIPDADRAAAEALRLKANEIALGGSFDPTTIYNGSQLIGAVLEAVHKAELRIKFAA